MVTLHRFGRVRPAVAVLGFVVLGMIFLPVDVPLAQFMLQDSMPGELRGIFRRAEIFGHAYGIAAIGLTVYLLDPKNRRMLPRLGFNCLAAGLSADLVKLCVWRVRPRTFDAMELVAQYPLGFAGTLFTSESWTWTSLLDSTLHSFPSAHTATAVAVVITLSSIYPAGRHWFTVLAVLCAMNRVDGGAHFASDVCWGAALGIAVVTFCYRSPHVNRWFGRWEQDLSADRSTVPWRQAVA